MEVMCINIIDVCSHRTESLPQKVFWRQRDMIYSLLISFRKSSDRGQIKVPATRLPAP